MYTGSSESLLYSLLLFRIWTHILVFGLLGQTFA
jgi:hypothetical protein